MTPKIKVHRMRGEDGQEEVTEVDLPEAEKLVADCYKWNCLALNTKTNEVIREIAPDVEDITIFFPSAMAGG